PHQEGITCSLCPTAHAKKSPPFRDVVLRLLPMRPTETARPTLPHPSADRFGLRVYHIATRSYLFASPLHFLLQSAYRLVCLSSLPLLPPSASLCPTATPHRYTARDQHSDLIPSAIATESSE